MDHAELASALRGVISDMHKRLRKQVYSSEGLSLKLSMTEITTLSYLYRGGAMTPSELAEINKIKKQSMSTVLMRLEEENLVKRTPSKEDGRKMTITLTPHAKNVVEKTRYERDVWLAGAMQAVLTEKEMRVLEAAVPLLERITNVD